MRGRWSEFVTGLAVLDFSSQCYFFFGGRVAACAFCHAVLDV